MTADQHHALEKIGMAAMYVVLVIGAIVFSSIYVLDSFEPATQALVVAGLGLSGIIGLYLLIKELTISDN